MKIAIPFVILLFVSLACKPPGSPENGTASNQITAEDKKYIPIALKYLTTVKTDNEKLVQMMDNAPLPAIRRSILTAKTSENNAFALYTRTAVPQAFALLDAQLREVHKLLLEAFDEYLTYWKDSKMAHISRGSDMHKTALVKAHETIKTFSEAVDGLRK